MTVKSHQFAARLEALAPDERRIMELLLERMEGGHSAYGPWNIQDGRDYRKEALEEALDGLHYCAAAILRSEK
jgi:hypothetical protein